MTFVLVFTRKLCHFLSSDLCLWYQIYMYSIFKCVLNECENVLKFIFQCCTCKCEWVLLSFENYISCQLCPKSCKFTENCNIFIIMVIINDFEQFTLGRVRLLLVIPSRIFFLLFTPNTLLDKQSNSYVKKMINDEVNAEWKEEVNAERMEEYCSLNCWYVVVHVYAVLCKWTLSFTEMYITMNTLC